MLRIRIVMMCLMMVAALGSSLAVAEQNPKDAEPKSVPAPEGTLCIPTGTLSIAPPESVAPRRSPVDFPHSRHFNFNCKVCHHKWENDDQLLTCRTSGCHDLLTLPKKSEKKKTETSLEVRYYKNAFHQRCIGCHKDIKQKNLEAEKKIRLADKAPQVLKTGPTGCVKCHPKQ